MPRDDSSNNTDILASVVNRMNGFAYRCRNNKDFTMLFMWGEVQLLTGYMATAFTGPERRSYADLTHPQDVERVYGVVDDALAARTNWSIDYRLVRADGREQWVHEVGGGVFDNDVLLYLEGIIIDCDAQKRTEIATVALLNAISTKTGLLLSDTIPIIDVLRTLRLLAINAKLEAGRAGAAGASFAVVAREVNRLADETGLRAARIVNVAAQLQTMLKQI